MSELRVPTQATLAEVLSTDGRSFTGRVFIPANSSRHSGSMTAEEWLNDQPHFFPFVPDDIGRPVLMNKRELLMLSVPCEPERADQVGLPRRRVVIECRDRRLEGVVVIDMPSHQSRMLDFLNRGDSFVTLRDGARCYLIQKERITRVFETGEE